MTGSGTLNDPYIISDVDDLQAMENNLAAYYELANARVEFYPTLRM